MAMQHVDQQTNSLRPTDTTEPPPGLALVMDPTQAVANAVKAATALMDVVKKKNLYKTINGKDYLLFEAWQTLAHFYGVSVGVERDEALPDGGWVSYSTAYHRGVPISHAIGMCSATGTWANREDNQRRSMAQTRANAKCLRNVLSFVAVLGGYAPTPAEEMDEDVVQHQPRPKVVDAPKATTTEARMCTVHNVPMEKRSNAGGDWWSHKQGGGWCSGKAA